MHRRDNWKLTLTMTRTGPGVHWHWPGFLCVSGSRRRGSPASCGVERLLDPPVAIAVLDLTDFDMKDPRFLNQKSFYFLASQSAWTAFDHHPGSKLKLERDLANTRTVP